MSGPYDGKRLCKHFDEYRGKCNLACPYCHVPFSDEECIKFWKWVHRDYKYPPKEYTSYYEPSDQYGFKEKTWEDVANYLMIEEGDFIGTWFVPYYKWKMFEDSEYNEYSYAWEQVENKFKKELGYNMLRHMYVVHGYNHSGTFGVLFIGLTRKDELHP